MSSVFSSAFAPAGADKTPLGSMIVAVAGAAAGFGSVSTTPAVEARTEPRPELRSEPWPEPRPESLADQITELAAHITAATYQLLVLIERFDREEGWAGFGVRSCAHWLNWQCGMNLGAARERVRVARALPSLPKISDAFRFGTVSYAKVRAMTRVATAENEDVLLNVALHGTAAHVERQVRAYRRVKRLEALQEEQGRHFRRELKCYEDEDGSWVFRARLTPEQGALLARALELAGDQLWQEQKDVPEDVSAETPEAPLSQFVPNEQAQRRADALGRIVEAFLSDPSGRNSASEEGEENRTEAEVTQESDRHTFTGGDRCCVHLHTDIETLKSDGESAEAELEVIPGRPAARVSAETSRRLSCDAGIVLWTEDGEGNALDIGRKSRTVPPALRRALQRRDRGCRFPGCSCTRYVDAHHVVHWADGGRTALDNLVFLCRAHHRKVHEEGFGVHMQNGQPVFTLPSGTVIPEVPKPSFRGNVLNLKARNRRSGLELTSGTLVSLWRGESMDLDLAVLGLLQRER